MHNPYLFDGERVYLKGPRGGDPAFQSTPGRLLYHLGADIGQARDPAAIVVLEQRQFPLPEYDASGKQLLEDQILTVRHAERLEGLPYKGLAQRIANMSRSANLAGRCRVALDATGNRAFVDLVRDQRILFTPVQITAGTGEREGDHGYWNCSKSALLEPVAYMIEAGELRIAVENRRELESDMASLRVSRSGTGQLLFDVDARDHHSDLTIALGLAVLSVRHSRRAVFEVGMIENWF